MRKHWGWTMDNRRRRRPNIPSYTSRCGDLIVRGTKSQLVDKYLKMADEATDHVMAEMFRQHAEHWRRKEI